MHPMRSPTGLRCRWRVLLLAAGWAGCLSSQAADPVRGAALFAQAPAPGLLGCIDCHSENPHLNNFGNIWVGRNAVALIERAVGTNTGGMGYLRSYRSPADLADIAAYLGNTPDALSFPLTAVGSSSAVLAVTVGTSTKTGVGAFAVRTEGDFTVRASSCGAEVPRFSVCTVDVAFTPTAGGPRSGALLIGHDGTPTPVRIALEGLAPERIPAVVTVRPRLLDFGTSPVGLPGALRNLTLANHSAEPLIVTDIQASAPPFVIAGSSCAPGTVLGSGQRCTVALRFDPTTAGASNGTLTIVHDGVGGRSTVVLAGSGLPGNVPLLRASPGAVSFGVTQVGDAPVLQTVTLRNEGNAPLTSIELGTTGVDFALEHNGCGGALPLAMGQTCQLQLAFRPTRAGNFSAELQIAGAGLAAVLRLPLYGGAALDRALLQASPSRLPFEETVGQASVQELVIVNRGAVATRVSSLALNGPGATEFAVEPRTTCQPGSLLAPGAGCIIALRFAPATAGLRAARVQVLTDGSDTPVAVAELAGTAHAQAAPRLLLDAVALTFAEQVVGSATAGVPLQVTAHNAGRGTLRWDTIQVVGDHAADFAIDGECLTSPTLAAGASCRLQLHFRPQAAGLRSASLRLAPATGTPLALVSLAGRAATVATAQPSPGKAALDLGSAPRGNRLDPGPWLDWQASATTPTQTGTGTGKVTLGPAWTVVNRGNATSEPLRWRIAGDAAADYSIDPASSCVSGAVLPAGGACFVRVRFHPGAGGVRAAELQLTTGDATLTQGLEGRCLAPAAGMLAVAPMAAVFQALPGQMPTAQSVTWRNDGAAALHVQSISLQRAAFTLSAPGPGACPDEAFDLLPGQSCQVEVGWTGSAAGASGALLVATGNDAWGGLSVPVTVSESPSSLTNVGAGGGAVGSAKWLLALAAAALALRCEASTRRKTESRHV